MNSAEKLEQKLEERMKIIAQNGNEGLHYETPKHYDNDKGSLYKIAVDRNWNAYQFDAIKRIDRAYKKGLFNEDIEKTKLVLDLMKNKQ